MIVHRVPTIATIVNTETGSQCLQSDEKIFLEVNREEAYLIVNLFGQMLPSSASYNIYDAIWKSGLFEHKMMYADKRLPFAFEGGKVDIKEFVNKLIALGFDPSKISVDLVKHYKEP